MNIPPHPVVRRHLSLLLLLCLAMKPFPVGATTVVPPTFEQLVGQSEYVVRAVARSAACEWRVEGENRHILTRVELEVKEVIAGTPPSPLVLTMLGGKIDDKEMIVDGAPKFVPGEEYILFVRRGNRKLFPLVALMHGQYPIVRDARTGLAEMRRSNGAPMYGVQDVSRPMSGAISRAASATGGAPLTPEAFAAQIRSIFGNQGARKLPK